MRIRRTFAGYSSEQRYYFQTDRKRVESQGASGKRKPDGTTEWLVGPRMAMITRCDLGRIFHLNLEAREYEYATYPPTPWTTVEMQARRMLFPAPSSSARTTLRIETTTTDTGERKDFFGHTARHVVTTRKQIPLEGSPTEPQETVTDGWYIDLHTEISCDRRLPSGKVAHSYLASGSSWAERAEFVDIGKPETGFPVQLVNSFKSSYKIADGSKKHYESRTETEVTELREETLDPALFEIPSGFKHVMHIERNPLLAQSSSWLSEIWARLKDLLD